MSNGICFRTGDEGTGVLYALETRRWTVCEEGAADVALREDVIGCDARQRLLPDHGSCHRPLL